jgi:hypothetical protein
VQLSRGRLAARAATNPAGWNWAWSASRSAALIGNGSPASATISIGSPARAAASRSASSRCAPPSVVA